MSSRGEQKWSYCNGNRIEFTLSIHFLICLLFRCGRIQENIEEYKVSIEMIKNIFSHTVHRTTKTGWR